MDNLAATIAQLNTSQQICGIVILTVALLCSVLGHSFSRKHAKGPKDKTLQHLINVFTPTSVSWEHDYSKLFMYKKYEKLATIQIHLSKILQDLYNGSLELRDERDLQPLLSGRLRVSGWTISLSIRSLWWWFRTAYHLALARSSLGVRRTPNAGKPPQLSVEYLQCMGAAIEDEDPLSKAVFYDLDSITYGHLESAIRGIKRSQVKKSIILEFTTLGLHVSHLSPLLIMCAVPFLEDESGKRTSTPLLLSLRHMVELLSNSAFKIRSICDVSSTHTNLLRQSNQQLLVDKSIRMTFTGNKSLERWRKARLLLAWEAALLADGHLVKWRVCCTPTR
ncbi:hypothetical protein AX15_006284 [Amanita polypyramis BW_CC]|nr:hypothetical protein AX15_006284 [Amanita polypyramis BW_CC]